MEINIFMTEIEKSLIANGISEMDAKKHARIILRLMSENGNGDISRVKTEREIYEIVSEYLGKTRRERAPSEIMSVKNITPPARGDTSLPADGSAYGRVAPDGARYKTSKFSAAEEAPDVGATRKMERTVKKHIVKTELSDGEKKEYRKIVLKNIPALLAVYFAIGLVSFVVYTLIALLITALLCVLVSVTVVGSVGSLAGLIYGVIKLFSIVPEGIFEIGFALVIAGVTLALCICIYNLSVRAAPIFWKKFTAYLKDGIVSRLKLYFNQMRKEASEK